MSAKIFLGTIEDERRQRLAGLSVPDANAWLLWERALTKCDAAKRQCLIEAYAIASQIDYRHGGLSSDLYFAHPLRVGALSFLYSDNCYSAVVGLLHNIIEVGDAEFMRISSKVPSTVSSQLICLNVNRKLQWDADYNQEYFCKLQEVGQTAVIVKIFDKLDNLFILGVNPDAEVRARYLLHFENYILPLIRSYTPDLESLAEILIKDSHRIGFICEREKFK